MNVVRILIACAGAVAVIVLLAQDAQAELRRVDANIVTGIDISDSIGSRQYRAQIEGVAQAILSDEFLAAVQSGNTGRVGFFVFLWYHRQIPIIQWTEIETRDDARKLSRSIMSKALIDIESITRASESHYYGRLTDISGAIEYGFESARSSPFNADRFLVNVVGNGSDNFGDLPASARDEVVFSGGTVNAVILDSDNDALAAYYRDNVIGGAGAFLLKQKDRQTFTEMMQRKFVLELLAANHRLNGDRKDLRRSLH